MQVSSINSVNYNYPKRQISFGIIDGMRAPKRDLDVYEQNVYVPRGKDAVKVNILAESPYEDKYVKCGTMYREIDKSKF